VRADAAAEGGRGGRFGEGGQFAEDASVEGADL
jgi:hypothetical protein